MKRKCPRCSKRMYRVTAGPCNDGWECDDCKRIYSGFLRLRDNPGIAYLVEKARQQRREVSHD